MKNKPFTKLFAVMAIGATPAAANPPAQPDPWAVTAPVSPPMAPEASSARADAVHAMTAMIAMGFAALAPTTPAPAVHSPGARPPALQSSSTPPAPRAPALPSDTAQPVAVTRPRTMPSGAPACGNVTRRAPAPIECTSPTATILADVPAPVPHAAVGRPADGAK